MLDDFREWLSDNLRYILLGLGALLIVLIVVLIVRLVNGSNRNSSESTQTTQTTVVQTTQEEEEATDQAEATVTAETPASATSDLVRDDAAILTLIEQYYTAVAEQDTRTLSTIVTPWDDDVQEQILANDMVEAYEDIKTYSKEGVKDGEYVVFASSEVKLSGIDTTVPTLDMLYVVTGDGGALQVASNMTTDEEISAYVTQVSSDADVQALVTEVNNKYAQALSSDETLSNYMSSSSATSSGEDGTQSDTSSDDSTSSDTSSSDSGTSSSSGDVTVGVEMSATTTVNIRQTASTSAAIMGVLTEGTTITVLADNGDGWVEISYNSSAGEIIGYVMSQYLTSTDSAALATDDTAA